MINNLNITASIVFYNSSILQVNRLLSSTVFLKYKIKVYLLVASDKRNEVSKVKFNCEYSIKYIENHGYGANINSLLLDKNFISDYHLILNPDIYFIDDNLDNLFLFFTENKNVGMIMPKVLNPDFTDQKLYRLLPTPLDMFVRRFIPIKYSKKLLKNKSLDIFNITIPTFIPFLSGSIMFIKLECYVEIGGFDERYFMYCEDLDLSRRIGKNHETVYFPKLSVIHDHDRASYKNLKMLLIHIKSTILYFNKFGWFNDKYRKTLNLSVIKKLKGC